MNGKPQPDQVVATADEIGQAKQIVELVKENKLVTALVLFVLWQTGALIQMYNDLGGAVCG